MRSWMVAGMMLVGCAQSDNNKAANADSSVVAKPAADTTASGQKACDLLSGDDVTAVTGIKHGPGIPTHDYAGSTQCRYDRDDGKQGITFTAHTRGDIENYRSVPGSIAVDKVGDAAVWNDATSQLAVRHGDAVLSISFLTPPSNLQSAIDLARRAVVRMQ